MRRTSALLFLALVVGAACSSDASSATTTQPAGPPIDMSAVETFDVPTRDHVSGDVDYPQNPPVGGNHDQRWQNCGIYDEPVRNENAVHSLEHGAVWLTYDPSLSDADVETLRALGRNHSHVLISPYEGLPSPVVASAWGKQLQVDSADDVRLAQFIIDYENGPTAPESGVTCSGQIGEPIE